MKKSMETKATVLGFEIVCSDCFAHYDKYREHTCLPWLKMLVAKFKKDNPEKYKEMCKNQITL
jgi:hypothetical protein